MDGGCIIHVSCTIQKEARAAWIAQRNHTYATSLEPALYLSPFHTNCTDEPPYARINISLSLTRHMMD
jgi:hypothetical protein